MKYLEHFKYFESVESKEFFYKVSELKKNIPTVVKKLNSLYNLMGIYFNRFSNMIILPIPGKWSSNNFTGRLNY